MDGIDLTRIELGGALANRDSSALESAKRLAGQGPGQQDDEVVQAFGKLFAQQLVRKMRESVDGGFFGKGAGSGIYESWFDEHLAEQLSANDALGMAGMIKAGRPVGEPVAEAAGGAFILGLPEEEEAAPTDPEVRP